MAFSVPNRYRITSGPLKSSERSGNNGAFAIPFRSKGRRERFFRAIASDGMGWEHVSVSLPDRCPTWEEMCFIKRMFWGEDDCVLQFHPAERDYVNEHPFCMHLWRPTIKEVPVPELWMV